MKDEQQTDQLEEVAELKIKVINIPKKIFDKNWDDLMQIGIKLEGKVIKVPDEIVIDFSINRGPLLAVELAELVGKAAAFYMIDA